MLIHPQFDTVAIRLGPLAVHWYGITYLVAFGAFLWLMQRRIRQAPYNQTGWAARDAEDLLFYGVLGVVLGGRLGFVVFYKPLEYLAHPLEIFQIWRGGMSFHGGLLGVITALAVFARQRGRSFWEVADVVAPCVPTGLAAGRLGNFINGELWGRAASPDLPWAMVFPQSGFAFPRHPSQLYQLALEGLLLFAVLWWFGRKPRPLGQVSGLFLMGYGLLRFVAEYFREPDAYLGLLALNLSMGQWLCLPMLVLGAVLFFGGYRNPRWLERTQTKRTTTEPRTSEKS